MTTEKTMPANEIHTYPDGTQVVGTAPFPAKSPKESLVAADPAPVAMRVPTGVKTSGAATPAVADNSAEVFKAKVEQQLASDKASGKSPDTPNPTTSSDKPELAAVTTADELDSTVTGAASPDLHKLTKGIKGDYTPEQKDAAVLQVARETKGPVATKTKAK